ncbi:MAG TPA: diacylglycerol kinase family protein [Candidatus Acidoferrum sp.]|nr:diacylglycerol kinase family protein [Candidatus Acidoferrum sp.]
MSGPPAPKSVLIVNPNSANGRTGKNWTRIEQEVRRGLKTDFDVRFTERQGHATILASEAIKEGYERVVAVGGDGTINEVMNGFFEKGKPLNPNAAMAVMSIGTGSDFVKTLEFPTTSFEAAERIRQGKVWAIDLGRCTFTGLDGEQGSRFFINIADFGSGGAVVDKVNRTTKLFGGQISFLWGILTTLPTYKNKLTKYQIDDSPEEEKVLNTFVVANGRYYGGGLKPAPDAQLDDALFDIVSIGDVGFLEAVSSLGKFRKGTYLEIPKVTFSKGKTVVASSEETQLVEMEGEVVGRLPARFEMFAKAMNIIV